MTTAIALLPCCACCGSKEHVAYTPSRTAYCSPTRETIWDWLLLGDGPLPDPNPDIPLCPECTVDHHRYWDDMWMEYYQSQ